MDLSSAERVAVSGAPGSQGLDWVGQAATAAWHGVLRLCGLGIGTPVLRMSEEWLEEHRRRSRTDPDSV